MAYRYVTPRIDCGLLECDIMESTHAMIAGAAGSGKSVLLRRCLLYAAAKGYETILIDPKKLELKRWKDAINTRAFACTIDSIVQVLRDTCELMDRRYSSVTDPFQTMCDGSTIWVVIEEYADLMCSDRKREIKALVQRLAQLGRAAKIHVLLCTQRPTRDIIDGAIKVNITTRCALHVPTAQDSRNIINENGAEHLPYRGQAYLLLDSGDIDLYNTHMIDEDLEHQVIAYMNERKAECFEPVPVAPQKKKSFLQRLFA